MAASQATAPDCGRTGSLFPASGSFVPLEISKFLTTPSSAFFRPFDKPGTLTLVWEVMRRDGEMGKMIDFERFEAQKNLRIIER